MSGGWKAGSLAAAILLVAVSAQPSRADSPSILKQFIGSWEGTATAYYPRDSARAPRVEQVTCACDTILKGTYIQCRSTWTRADGRSRDLVTLWNYDAEKDSFNVLFLYDNWSGKVNYNLAYDDSSRTLTGFDTFTAPGDVPARERVHWNFSADGGTIVGTEYNHFETDPEDYWPLTFEFTWRRR